jgi:hypothetical protein
VDPQADRGLTPGARFALRLVVGVGLLALILSRMGLPTIGRGLGPGTLAGVLGAALLLLSGQSIAALRWKVIMGPGSPPWRYLARLYVIGGFFSLFLPTQLEEMRYAHWQRRGRHPGRAGSWRVCFSIERSGCSRWSAMR